MTIVYSIDGVGGTAADVAVKAQTVANWKLVSTYADPKTGSASSVYTDISATDPRFRRTLTYKVVVNKDGSRNLSVALSTFSREVDNVSGEVITIKPITSTWFFNLPAMQVEPADLVELAMNVYASTFTALTSKVPNDVVFSSLMFGLTKILS